MHEVAVSRPFLELDVREPLEPLALTVGDRPSEHPEAGDVEVGHDRVDPCLELGRIAAKRHLPVADDDALAHLVCGEHERAERLGNPFEPEAVLERRPHLREAGAAERRLEPVDEFREWADVRAVVDGHNATRRMGGCVEAGEPTRHGMPDDDRPLDCKRVE